MTPEQKREYNREYRKNNQWALYQYEHRRRNPERHAKYRMRVRAKRRGITEAEYRAMHVAQGGECAICHQAIVLERLGAGKGTHGNIACIDHSHETSAVRGLLCQQCNIGIGAFKDSVKALEAAIAYLRTYEKTR